jgi:hypothetical protein
MASIDPFGLQALRFFLSRMEGPTVFWTVLPKDLGTEIPAGRCASRATNITQPAVLIDSQHQGFEMFPTSAGFSDTSALLLHYRQSDSNSQRLSGRGQLAILQPDVLLASRPFQRDSDYPFAASK